MKKHIKKLVFLSLIVAMMQPLSVTAIAVELPLENYNNLVNESAKNEILEPNAWYYSYSVTIPKNYNSLSEIPDTYYYEEYNSGVGAWCSGYLTFQSATKLSNGMYKAIFSGTIGSYIF
ncbi:MAG: hypothetical protein GX913_01680 [Clostridiales bacterium]|nr:hypothetical protein [Clostridiales bacterium]